MKKQQSMAYINTLDKVLVYSILENEKHHYYLDYFKVAEEKHSFLIEKFGMNQTCQIL